MTMRGALGLGKELVETIRVETDHDFLPDHQSGSGAAVVGAYKLKNEFLVGGDITLFEFDTSILEVSLDRPAGRSTGLRENDDVTRHGGMDEGRGERLQEVLSTEVT